MSWRRFLTVVLVALIVVPVGLYFASDKIRSVLPRGIVEKVASRFFTTEKLRRFIPPTLPLNRPIKEAYWLPQGWSEQERFWFHHTSQGTSTLPVPYDWFVALEQPGIGFLGDSTLMKDPEYLRQFGFVASPRTLNTARGTLSKYGYCPTCANAPPPEEIPAAADAEDDLQTREQKQDITERSVFAQVLSPVKETDPERRRAVSKFPEALQKRLPENVDGLPVGFARTPGYNDPITGKGLVDQIGFTCAACHTGQIEYKGVSVRYDGGSSMVNLGAFRDSLGLALYYTLKIPGRFKRFADRVLGYEHSDADRTELKRQFGELLLLVRGGREREHDILVERGKKEGREIAHTEEGFGRLDALNRIGNQVFYENFLAADPETNDYRVASKKLGFDISQNYVERNAPVSFPPLWDTPWFLWAQYDASIQQPIVRNAGEALGVGARVNLVDKGQDGKGLYRSSIDVADLHNIEQQLAKNDPFSGEQAFKGLKSPKWPAALFPEEKVWQIDAAKVRRGRKIYAEICVECHRPPVNDREFANTGVEDNDFWAGKWWVTLGSDSQRFLRVKEMKAVDVGTDGATAKVMAIRKVKLPALLEMDVAKDLSRWNCGSGLPGSVTETLFSLALMVVVDKTVLHWLDENNVSPGDRAEMLGVRPNCPTENLQHYKARPLDGVWATAPYLHNGSVPNLWSLLSPDPRNERPQIFCVGSREFDPVSVGFEVVTDCAKGDGLTLMDTRTDGNRNTGHEFTAEKGTPMSEYKAGQLGRKLDTDERESLIEYLKTL